MILKDLQLNNFKNIVNASLEFSPKLNCLLGDNGMGKSNLLDSIYYLSFCKSFTGVTDAMLIHRGEDFGMLSAHYLRHGAEEDLAVGFHTGRRKSFKRSGKEYQRLSEHIGKFPLVLVSPADMALIEGTGEERRKFMDIVISQTDARYLDMLIRYNRALEQRNRLLRDGIEDANLYVALEISMDMAAEYLTAKRSEWIDKMASIFNKYYSAIAGDDEVAVIHYKSHLMPEGASAPQSLTQVLEERRQRDRLLKHTSAGPHRDDIEMELSGMPVRRTASQGQAKTYTIALRLAQYEFLKQAVNMSPLLLLDDIFDKLDAHRVERIMKMVASDTFGQIFITDTNRKHLDEILTHSAGDYAMWSVAAGEFTPSGRSNV